MPKIKTPSRLVNRRVPLPCSAAVLAILAIGTSAVSAQQDPYRSSPMVYSGNTVSSSYRPTPPGASQPSALSPASPAAGASPPSPSSATPVASPLASGSSYRPMPSSAPPAQAAPPPQAVAQSRQAAPQEDPSQAMAAVRPVKPNNSQYIQQATACMNEKKSLPPAAAVKNCDAVIDETIRNLANAYYFRGTATLAQRDYDGAIASFTQAIKLDPEQSEYLSGRATAYEAKNDINRAMADYNEAIKVDPNAVYAFSNRGAAFQRKGDYARAAADYGEVTRLQPNNLDAWSARCWVRAVTPGQTQQALNDCNQALRIKADAADVLDTRGFVYLKLGQSENAIKDYDAALKLDPKLAGSLYGRGLARTKKGDRDGGTEDMNAAKALKANIADEFTRYGVK